MRRTKHPTLLDRFIEQNRISQTELERRSRVSRRHIFHVRKGTSNPTLRCMIAITAAVGEMIGRDVRIEELFDVSGRRRAS
jgi:predicted transcriptional regulator